MEYSIKTSAVFGLPRFFIYNYIRKKDIKLQNYKCVTGDKEVTVSITSFLLL